MLVIPENLPEEEDINSELLDDNVFEDNDRLLDLDDDDDFELVVDAIDVDEDLEYSDLEFTKECWDDDDDCFDIDITDDWVFYHEWDYDDLKGFIEERYPEGLKLGDLDNFDNDGFYEYLLDLYEEDAKADASKNWSNWDKLD